MAAAASSSGCEAHRAANADAEAEVLRAEVLRLKKELTSLRAEHEIELAKTRAKHAADCERERAAGKAAERRLELELYVRDERGTAS